MIKLDELNYRQQRVVEYEGSVLLTACPGSGKTRVITNKIAYELSRQERDSKRKILALTFTNRAANEMYERLRRLGIDTPRVWCGTIHAFCMEWIIRPYSGYHQGLRYGFRVIDELEEQEIVERLKEKHGIVGFEQPKRGLNPDGSFICQEKHQDFVMQYYDELSSRKLIDYDLILHFSNQILSENPQVARVLGDLFSYIFVDEYQDTRLLQYSIIFQILNSNGVGSNVMFVGDRDQAIYESLGGVALSHSELQSSLKRNKLVEFTLEGNYRSSGKIIEFIGNFQNNRLMVTEERLQGDRQSMITLNKEIHKDNLADEIKRLIDASLKEGIPQSEICVLVPQWWLVIPITRQLREAMPDVTFNAFGASVMSKVKSNVWYKVARLFLAHPSPRKYRVRYEWASEVLEMLQSHIGRSLIDKLNPEKELLRIINSIDSSHTVGREYVEDCLQKLISELSIELEKYGTLQIALQNYLSTFVSDSEGSKMGVPTDVESIKRFYQHSDGVLISTGVGVKGEEFETVIAYGLLDGYVPHWSEKFDKGVDETIRANRLLYVICSRARNRLHLIAERGRKTKKGSDYVITPSLELAQYDYDEF